MPDLALEDITLHYEIDGSGPPLLMLAGMMGDNASWGALLRLLTPHFTVIRPDNRTTANAGANNGPAGHAGANNGTSSNPAATTAEERRQRWLTFPCSNFERWEALPGWSSMAAPLALSTMLGI